MLFEYEEEKAINQLSIVVIVVLSVLFICYMCMYISNGQSIEAYILLWPRSYIEWFMKKLVSKYHTHHNKKTLYKILKNT